MGTSIQRYSAVYRVLTFGFGAMGAFGTFVQLVALTLLAHLLMLVPLLLYPRYHLSALGDASQSVGNLVHASAIFADRALEEP